jgi:hypothetical protein
MMPRLELHQWSASVFDVEKAGQEYDYFMDNFGCPPPVGLGRFDRRVLIPRGQLPNWVERDAKDSVSLQELDELERQGVFSWRHGAGEDGRELGVPVYVRDRIGLCRTLLREGWTIEEVREIAEWEEWVVTDMVEGDLRYENDDRLIVLGELRERLAMLESECIARLPVEARPAAWTPSGRTTEIKALSSIELAVDLADHQAMVRRLEPLDLSKAPAELRREVGRRAHQLRVHYEGVRLLSVVSDRTLYEAGFSPHVRFDGVRQLIGDPTRLESFGAINWRETLQSWRIPNDPDHAPVRLPGVVCVGGTTVMPNALTPEEYAERYRVFRLSEYADAFADLVGDRRCRHCGKPLPKRAHDQRLYCDSRCSQANRQKRYRMREKQEILRRRRSGAGD